MSPVKKPGRGRPLGNPGKFRMRGGVIVWPKAIEARYDISRTTRYLWEQSGRLPPRDVFIGGKAAGWSPAVLEAMERGPAKRKAAS